MTEKNQASILKTQAEYFLSREQIAEAMNAYIHPFMPDECIKAENVVEVPAAHSETFAQCKVWTACCGPFVMIAVNHCNMAEAAIYMHS